MRLAFKSIEMMEKPSTAINRGFICTFQGAISGLLGSIVALMWLATGSVIFSSSPKQGYSQLNIPTTGCSGNYSTAEIFIRDERYVHIFVLDFSKLFV